MKATHYVCEVTGQITYEVNVANGWINASETEEDGRGGGSDVFGAMSPTTARWLAKQLTIAADEAETHARWRRFKA